MKKLILIISLSFLTLMMYAKDIVVTGVVLDDTGEVLPGVAVVLKGTTTGVSTDVDGKYSIKVPEDKRTLVFTFVGMDPKEAKAPLGGGILNVRLESQDRLLDEVIVTGYGTYKKSAYAGSASTVKMGDKEDIPAIDFSTMLQGGASGVQVNSISGQPGSKSDIQIRGMTSISGSKSPLFVIDGVPVISENLDKTNSDIGLDPMASINPSDIENITVIKDAAAASLYGSRAASGVIVITTKRGKEGKPKFKFKSDWGWSDKAMDYLEVMGGAERRELLKEGLRNKAMYGSKPIVGEEAIQAYVDDNIDTYALEPKNGYADWEDALFRKGSHSNYELSASGGDKKFSFYSSLGYTDQQGIVKTSGFNRISGRLNVSYKLTNNIEIGANVLFSRMKQELNGEGLTFASPYYSTRHKLSASDPIYNPDGSYNMNIDANNGHNPKQVLDLNSKKSNVNRSFNTLFVNYKFLNDFLFNSTMSYDVTNTSYKSWTDPRTKDGLASNGRVLANKYEYRQFLWKNNLTYTKQIAEKHNIDALAGYEMDMYTRDYVTSARENYPTIGKPEASNGGRITDSNGAKVESRMVSYLMKANYNYDNKYFIGGSVRLDASTKFANTDRWGTFWSVSGAWRLGDEKFMESTKGWLSDLKLRASYGTNGTMPGGYFDYMNLVDFGHNYMDNPGKIESQLGDKKLKWEKSNNLNVGLDFRLFDRVGMSVEFYEKKSSDLLLSMPISSTVGFSSYKTNIGEMKNTGVEFEINADMLGQKSPVQWNSSLNFGHNKNKLTKLAPDQTEYLSNHHTHRIGNPYWSYYLVEFAGISPETGNPLYYLNKGDNPRDVTENGGEAAKILYKSPDPKLTGGWTNSFKYKFIDFSFTFTFSLGGYSYDNTGQKTEHGGYEANGAIQTFYRDRWQKPGDQAKYEMFMVDNPKQASKVANTRRVHSTDHLRMKNMTVGFTLPSKWSKAAKMDKVRAYFSAVNLFTFAAYDRYDPEVRSNGEVKFESPKLKTMTFGIEINF